MLQGYVGIRKALTPYYDLDFGVVVFLVTARGTSASRGCTIPERFPAGTRITNFKCVLSVYYIEPSPLQDSSGVSKRATYSDPPPHPESIAAQAAYPYRNSAIAQVRRSPARMVSTHWGPPRACYRVPYCE